MPLRSPNLRRAFAALAVSRASESSSAKPESLSPPADIAPVGKGILARLAVGLEKAAGRGAYADAEREAKDAQDALIEAGDREGSKLAFAALLSARKGNLEALKRSVEKIRKVV